MATYDVDGTHSEITFTVRHMMFAKVRGQFKKWTTTLAYDPVEPHEVEGPGRDRREQHRHQRGQARRAPAPADFFDAEKFPKITFKSKRIEGKLGGKGHFKLVGDLTLHGATQSDARRRAEGGGKDPWGTRARLQRQGSLDRGDYGLKWNQALEAGGVVVGDKVEIEIEAQVVQAKASAEASASAS